MVSRIDMTKICLLLLVIVILAAPSAGQNNFLEGHDSNRTTLSVYVDRAGKSLVTGYVEDITGLDFLSSSHYRYKNETNQLYALTDSLTSKYEENWTLRFASEGYYVEYHVKFLLPGETRLRKIICSAGLEYIVYTSNESFAAEIMGYDLLNPTAILEYQMPLEDAPGNNASDGTDFSFLLVALLAVLCIFTVAIWSRRMSIARFIEAASIAGSVKPDPHVGASVLETAQIKEAVVPVEQSSDVDEHEEAFQHVEIASTSFEVLRPSEDRHDIGLRESIVVTRKMAAVMEVLTARERAVLEALIKHGGRMTQADIRYETGTPGSSLTGILVSLERRKIVIKKEWGRTNVIELSEWFLSEKEDF
jgi:hypothetical protein